jgi:hypothetical protein
LAEKFLILMRSSLSSLSFRGNLICLALPCTRLSRLSPTQSPRYPELHIFLLGL